MLKVKADQSITGGVSVPELWILFFRKKFRHVFEGEIHSQDGAICCSEGEETKIDDIITMDWLVDNIEGDIPLKDELQENAQSIVEMKGVIKESEN